MGVCYSAPGHSAGNPQQGMPGLCVPLAFATSSAPGRGGTASHSKVCGQLPLHQPRDSGELRGSSKALFWLSGVHIINQEWGRSTFGFLFCYLGAVQSQANDIASLNLLFQHLYNEGDSSTCLPELWRGLQVTFQA